MKKIVLIFIAVFLFSINVAKSQIPLTYQVVTSYDNSKMMINTTTGQTWELGSCSTPPKENWKEPHDFEKGFPCWKIIEIAPYY